MRETRPDVTFLSVSLEMGEATLFTGHRNSQGGHKTRSPDANSDLVGPYQLGRRSLEDA